jgi:hypothetical protein
MRLSSTAKKQIGRELGVQVLEGSVRRTGEQGRVNVQLIGNSAALSMCCPPDPPVSSDLNGEHRNTGVPEPDR